MTTSGNDRSYTEKRVIERRHLVFYLRIFDGMGSRVLGHLVDVSTRGAMLVCDAPIQLNQEFRLRMRLTRFLQLQVVGPELF